MSGPAQECRLFYFFVSNAAWQKKECGAGDLGIGEFRFSYRKISTSFAWEENNRVEKCSTSRINRMIEWLKGQGLIEVLGTAPPTTVRVVNYEQFQGIPSGKLRIPGASLEQHGTPNLTGLGAATPGKLAPDSRADRRLDDRTRNAQPQQLGTQLP